MFEIEGLEQFSVSGEDTTRQSIGALNKKKDAKDLLPKLRCMLVKTDGKPSSRPSLTSLHMEGASAAIVRPAKQTSTTKIWSPAQEQAQPEPFPKPGSVEFASDIVDQATGNSATKVPGSPARMQASSKLQNQSSSAKKQKKKRTLDETDPKQQERYIGQRVAKYFDKVLFRGHVVQYFPKNIMDSKKEAWQVLYEDGDSEDVYETQLLNMIARFKKNA